MGNQLDLEANARWVSGNHLSLHQLCLLFGRVPVSLVCYRSLHSCCTFRFAASSGMAASSSSKQILRATGCFAYAAVLGIMNKDVVKLCNNQQPVCMWHESRSFNNKSEAAHKASLSESWLKVSLSHWVSFRKPFHFCDAFESYQIRLWL